MADEKLTARQRAILLKLVETYVKLAQPVGSQALTEAMRLNLSSATVRNEMSELEGLGYITHPHTSAGRLPTDKGYRYYVNEVAHEDMTDARLAKQVMSNFSREIHDLDKLISLTSDVLAALTEQASIVLLPETESAHLNTICLVPIDYCHLLVVWTTTDGVITHRVIEVVQTPVPDLCRRVAVLLNEELAGQKIADVEPILLAKLENCRDTLRSLYEFAREVMHLSIAQATSPALKTSGSKYMFEKPEFRDVFILQRVFRFLNGGDQNIWSLIQAEDWSEGVRVRIGGENPVDLKECSIVSAPYTLRGHAAGLLGVIGPRRMPYRRAMSVVYHVSQMLSEALERLGEQEKGLTRE